MLVVMMRLIHPRLKNSPFEALIVSYSTYRWRKMAPVLNKLNYFVVEEVAFFAFWSRIEKKGGNSKRVIASLLASTGAPVVMMWQ